IEAWLQRSAIPVARVLDLACGTGTIACLLAARGFAVTATDASEKMLTQAAQKAAALERAPLFLLQSMPRLRLLEPMDAAVSTLDSVNYLTRTADLRQTFRRVYRALRAGGGFLFDVNTPHKLRRMDGQTYCDESEGAFCVWNTYFSERDRVCTYQVDLFRERAFCVWNTYFSERDRVCTYQVDLFRERADGAWTRSFEEHRERAWSETELREALTAAGFEKIAFSGDLTRRRAREDDERWIVTCRKPIKSERGEHRG
ncbi:MAG: class I SAM-dependent methyltransferase, partial [Oscillibacter sp.]|nr:class I SAM-dependent methyltransferase [Oscillibacter sp.]